MPDSIDDTQTVKVVPVTVTHTRSFERWDAYNIVKPGATAQDIRKHLLEGEPGLLLANQAVSILKHSLAIPIQIQCPRCREQINYQPTQNPSKLQIQTALAVLNHTAGKPIERSERVLRDAEYAKITIEAIKRELPNITDKQLRRIGARIVEALAEEQTTVT